MISGVVDRLSLRLVPDELWALAEPLIPVFEPRPQGRRSAHSALQGCGTCPWPTPTRPAPKYSPPAVPRCGKPSWTNCARLTSAPVARRRPTARPSPSASTPPTRHPWPTERSDDETRLDERFSDPGTEATCWAETTRALEEAQISWLTTVRADGRPHVTPLVAVWLDEAVHFSTGTTEQKYLNLTANPNVVLTTGRNTWDDALDVVVEGLARRVTDRPTLDRPAPRPASPRLIHPAT